MLRFGPARSTSLQAARRPSVVSYVEHELAGELGLIRFNRQNGIHTNFIARAYSAFDNDFDTVLAATTLIRHSCSTLQICFTIVT